jgi:hypothetical protein
VVAEHHREIGPWAIASALGLAAAACFVWVTRKAPPFSWDEVPSPNVAFDYVLLLGLLLFASDLAYLEAQFAVLGPGWPHHLLVVGAVYLVAAYRWDSRTTLGLALTTLAAWRGLAVGLLSSVLGASDASALRSNALALGAIYVAAAVVTVRGERKAHFDAVFVNGGLLLVLGALVSGVMGERGTVWGIWLAVLLPTAGLVMWLSFRLRRSLPFAQGVLAAYLGLLRLVFAPYLHESSAPFALAALLGIAALVLVFASYRRMSER